MDSSSEIEQNNATIAMQVENDQQQQGRFMGDATGSVSHLDELGGDNYGDYRDVASPRRPQSALHDHENYGESHSSSLRRRTSPANSPKQSGHKTTIAGRISSIPPPPDNESDHVEPTFDEDNMQRNSCSNHVLSNDATTNTSQQAPHPNNANEQHNSQQHRTDQEAHMLQQFWRTYDTVIILSIFAVLGIMFRMMSATWFRMELGVVFSEDSALGTNLPLNIWSCFLMGLLCSGR